MWKTYKEVYDIQEQFAKGKHICVMIRHIGIAYYKLSNIQHVEGKQWRFMGVYSKNREEWAVVDLACLRSDITIVPFFESLGPEALKFVLN